MEVEMRNKSDVPILRQPLKKKPLRINLEHRQVILGTQKPVLN